MVNGNYIIIIECLFTNHFFGFECLVLLIFLLGHCVLIRFLAAHCPTFSCTVWSKHDRHQMNIHIRELN